jgi:hypothetical protein
MNRRNPSTAPLTKPCRRVSRAADFFCTAWPALSAALLALLPAQADGQEVPRPSYARQKEKAALPKISNFKIGEVLLRVDAHLTTEFMDNVDLSKAGKADFVVSPDIGISAIWAVTKLNTLRFRAGLGYSYYFNSPNLNRQNFVISPDSALSFDVYAGDVRINFHNQFSLQQDAISQGTLSGVAQVERFTNMAGLSILWDTNDIVWTLGYDHYNFLTLGGANSSSGTAAATLSNLDHSTDQISASAAVKMSSVLIGGIEGTIALTDYPKQPDSNFTSVSAGPYFELQVTKYTHAFLSGGFKGFYSGVNAPGSVSLSSTTPAQLAKGDPTGYYANFSLVHRMNRYYSDRLDIGHTDEVEGLSGHIQTNSVHYTGNLRVSDKITLGSGIYFEDVNVISGNALGGSTVSDYRRFGISLNTAYQITRSMDASFTYQYVRKDADRDAESYMQNRVTISLGYRF